MPDTLTAHAVLDRHYLELRAKLLEVGATLDRIDRGAHFSETASDPRLEKLRTGIQILLSLGGDRAERIQLLFSDEYLPQWREPESK